MKNRGKKNACVIWKGSVGIEQSLSLRKELLGLLDSYDSVTLDISGVQDIDIAAMQIILAGVKEAKKKNCYFAVTGTISDPVLAALKMVNIQLPVEEVAHV